MRTLTTALFLSFLCPSFTFSADQKLIDVWNASEKAGPRESCKKVLSSLKLFARKKMGLAPEGNFFDILNDINERFHRAKEGWPSNLDEYLAPKEAELFALTKNILEKRKIKFYTTQSRGRSVALLFVPDSNGASLNRFAAEFQKEFPEWNLAYSPSLIRNNAIAKTDLAEKILFLPHRFILEDIAEPRLDYAYRHEVFHIATQSQIQRGEDVFLAGSAMSLVEDIPMIIDFHRDIESQKKLGNYAFYFGVDEVGALEETLSALIQQIRMRGAFQNDFYGDQVQELKHIAKSIFRISEFASRLTSKIQTRLQLGEMAYEVEPYNVSHSNVRLTIENRMALEIPMLNWLLIGDPKKAIEKRISELQNYFHLKAGQYSNFDGVDEMSTQRFLEKLDELSNQKN